MPNTESCTVGRDLLSDEAEYDKTDITGALPYTRHYETTLGYNFNRVDDMTNGQKSIGGWTDNYNNYVFVEPGGDGKSVIMRLRLPGDKDDTYYILSLGSGNINYYSPGNNTPLTSQQVTAFLQIRQQQIAQGKAPPVVYTTTTQLVSSVQRIFSSTPLIFETSYIAKGNGNYIWSSNTGDRSGSMSTDHRDRQLVITNAPTSAVGPGGSGNQVASVNLNQLSFYVNNHGIIYQFQYQASIGGAGVYKMIRVIYPDGRILGLSYETWGGIGLLAVADNRGHLLTLTRQLYMDGNAVRSVVNGVVLSAQNGQPALPDRQAVSYTYQVSNWTNFQDGLNERYYALTSATNTYGQELYAYNQTAALSAAEIGVNSQMGGAIQNFYGAQYQVPVLTDAYDNARNSQIHWDYQTAPGGSGWTMLKDSYKPFQSSNNVLSTARTGIIGGVNNTGGSWSYNYTFTTNARLAPTSSAGSYTVSGNASSPLVFYNFSGFPCITYNKVPVSQEIMDVNQNHVTDIYDANGIHTHFTYDDLNRVATFEEATGSSLDRTTTYTYGNLSNGATNTYNIPTIISAPESTTTNLIEPAGRIIQSVKTYPQSGSSTRIWNYSYFEDSTQSNYGLLQYV
ncbi:MAG: hypothetical protein ACHP9Y_05935, partial [Gammaproteobacteria bacterium]